MKDGNNIPARSLFSSSWSYTLPLPARSSLSSSESYPLAFPARPWFSSSGGYALALPARPSFSSFGWVQSCISIALPARFSFLFSAGYTLALLARPLFLSSRGIHSYTSSQVLFFWGYTLVLSRIISLQRFIYYYFWKGYRISRTAWNQTVSNSETVTVLVRVLVHDFVQRAHFKVIMSIWNMINYVSVVFQRTKNHFN